MAKVQLEESQESWSTSWTSSNIEITKVIATNLAFQLFFAEWYLSDPIGVIIYTDRIVSDNRFYFCGNGEWWDTPCVPGATFPHDRYGYSLIAVEVTPGNKIASITSRWNTYSGDSGNFITEEELKKILGGANYDKMLCITV